MITTAEFKRSKGLTNSSFSRLVKKIEAAHPGVKLTNRLNSVDWEILRIDLFEAALVNRRPTQAPQPTQTQGNSTAIALSHVDVLGGDEVTTLDQISAKHAGRGIQPVNLNGAQSDIIQGLQRLTLTYEAVLDENEKLETALNQRELTLEKVETVARRLTKKIQSEVERNEQIQERADALSSKEDSTKKLLEALLQQL